MHTNVSKVAVSFATLMSLIAIPAAFADSTPRCDTVYFTGATQQSAPNTPFIGELTMTNLLSGQSESADVVTMLLGNVSTDGGQAVTSHEINGGEEPGVHVVTFDEAQLIPQGDGVFTLISHMRIEAGKGRYNCGELVIGADPFAPANNATVTFDQQGIGTAEYAGFGRLCRCKPADN